jgi:hypothetical protein
MMAGDYLDLVIENISDVAAPFIEFFGLINIEVSVFEAGVHLC